MVWIDLNNSQKKIIETINGPILVIAGAGSGKTRVITYRIAYMIQKMGINPYNILALTFTRKSAREMKFRISNMINSKNLEKITLGTFHSIFSSILRKESHWLGYNQNYTIYDQKDSENVIKKILEDINLDISFSPKEIRRIISEYKNNLCSINNGKLNRKEIECLSKIYKFYIQKCHQSNALDFDDILLKTNHLFYKFPNVLNKYRNKFKYILIDEYQDTNLSQNKIIKNLAFKHQNVFVVGDDAQSIYSFRGANISNILNFHLDYKNVKIFRLEQNYRSTYHIVKASNNIISFNKNQIIKKIWTDNEKGEKIEIYCAFSEKEEAQYIASSILSIKKNKKLHYENFAILYRANIQSHIIEYIFKEKKIPYKIHGSISFEKRKEIRDLLAYLRVISNLDDEESFLRILKKESSQKTIRIILDLSKKRKIKTYGIIKNLESYYHLLMIKKKTKDKFKQIIYTIEKLHSEIKIKDSFTIVKNVANLLLEKYPKNYKIEDFKPILDNVLYHTNEQKKLKNNGDVSLSGFLQKYYLEINENSNNDDNEKNKVSLMTVHLSKGLEFPIVFITGLEENLFPSKSSLNKQSKIEEERRLFYVALTRAKKKAILTYTKYRFLWGEKRKNYPSRFINELNENYIKIHNHTKNFSQNLLEKSKINFLEKKNNNEQRKFQVGSKIFHKKFGIGIILDFQNENKIALIKFQNLGKKRILLELALDKIIIYS
ncbi:ATP-dependent helicase [Blattabacterium cuenoti]|uniref:ATP-dependent helicase n=1 Tax=Blattabacterium cuenoti TaxID=1653831 RepID=UPI00163CB963|nr:UvrD-helicase domain-containing protein [Blattabacterium cuenoti]